MALGARPRLMKLVDVWETKGHLGTRMISAELRVLHRLMTSISCVSDAASKLSWYLTGLSDSRYDRLEQLGYPNGLFIFLFRHTLVRQAKNGLTDCARSLCTGHSAIALMLKMRWKYLTLRAIAPALLPVSISMRSVEATKFQRHRCWTQNSCPN
jgi:hypothetical protein